MARRRKDENITDEQMDSLPPTPKERRFLQEYFTHGNVAKAAIDSGICGRKKGLARVKAASAGSILLKKLRPQIEDAMNAEGLSMVQIIQWLKQGVEAEIPVVVREEVEGDGKVRAKRTVITAPDWKSRAKFLEMAMKARGMFPSTPAVVRVQGGEAGKPVQVEHMESIAHLSTEEKKQRLDELIEASKRGPIHFVPREPKR